MRNVRHRFAAIAITVVTLSSSMGLGGSAHAAPAAPRVVDYAFNARVADDNGTTAHIQLYWQSFDPSTAVEVRMQAGTVAPAAGGGQIVSAGAAGQTATVAVASKSAWSFRVTGAVGGQPKSLTVTVGHLAIAWAVTPDTRVGYEGVKVTGQALLNGGAPGVSVPLRLRCSDLKNVDVSLNTTTTGAFSGAAWLTSAAHCHVTSAAVAAYSGAPGFFAVSTSSRLIRGRVFFNSGGTIENFFLSSGTTSLWTHYYVQNAPRNTLVSVQLRSAGVWRTVSTVRSGTVVKGLGSSLRFTVRVSGKRGSTYTFRLFTPATATTFAAYQVVSRPVF